MKKNIGCLTESDVWLQGLCLEPTFSKDDVDQAVTYIRSLNLTNGGRLGKTPTVTLYLSYSLRLSQNSNEATRSAIVYASHSNEHYHLQEEKSGAHSTFIAAVNKALNPNKLTPNKS